MKFDSNFKVAALADFARSTVNVCRASKLTEANFVSLVDRTDKLEKELTFSIKKDKISSTLEKADGERDVCIRTISALIQAAVLHPDAKIREAGTAAKAVFDKYGVKITRAKYEEESTYVRSLLTDFSAIAAPVKAISGLNETILSLKGAEEVFEAEYAAYAKALSNASKSATAIKKELVLLLNSGLLPYIDAVSLVNDAYKPLQSEIETILSRL